jgi:hypothetical protein
MTRSSVALCLTTGLLLAACSPDGATPTAPATATASAMESPTLSASMWGPETPPFNNEIILRDVSDGRGFGLVKFRQPNDADRIVYLDTWVRDLKPNTTYQLQRATDTAVNVACAGTNWLTLGRGLTPQAITTDERGTGRESLFRNLGTTAIGSTFDIHFRVIEQASGSVVLESDCYQFVVTQ